MTFLKKSIKNSVNRIMKVIRYLIPVWCGVFVYTIFSIGFGAKGISAYSQLESERNRELANIENLKGINRDLENTRDSLANNKENFTVYARELGFAAPGEYFIRIIGLGNAPKSMSSPGQVVSPEAPEYAPDIILRIFSFFTVITVFISVGAYDFLRHFKDRE